jgi:arginyl-tRNA synthetase
MQDTLRRAIWDAVAAAAADGSLPEVSVPDFDISAPPRPEMGDFACNVAMALAGQVKRPPREVAQVVIGHLPAGLPLERAEVAGPGFINLFLSAKWLHETLRRCLTEAGRYGSSASGAGRRVQIEFVSANPVGPLHIGNARGGPYGDVLASLLQFTGHYVEREFYVNDARDNTQLQTFGRSLRLRYLEALGEGVEPFEGMYRGEYVAEYARTLVERHGESLRDVPENAEGWVRFADLVVPGVVEELRRDLEEFGIRYDVWFSERSLHDSGAVKREIARLLEVGAAYERDGAVWLRTQEHGDEEDRVLVRRNGAPTYIASDAAYVRNKFERGFDLAIYVLGPDHAGYVARMKAAVEAAGIELDRVEIAVSQMVRLVRGGEPVRLSKRKGQVAALRDLLAEVGRDAARFHFLTRALESHMDFDLDLATKQANENPVYYVQYAHTRTCGVLRKAESEGSVVPAPEAAALELLAHPDELALLRKIADFPGEIELSASTRAPHRLTHFARELAALLHQFYTTCRVVDPDQPALTGARLSLVRGTQIVLATICRLLGIAAPETM